MHSPKAEPYKLTREQNPNHRKRKEEEEEKAILPAEGSSSVQEPETVSPVSKRVSCVWSGIIPNHFKLDLDPQKKKKGNNKKHHTEERKILILGDYIPWSMATSAISNRFSWPWSEEREKRKYHVNPSIYQEKKLD